jgi:hypothetical protein
MRTRVFLTPSDNTLVGKFGQEYEHIHVVLDTSKTGFIVQLPDCKFPEHKEFVFYNQGINNAVLKPVSGQFIKINGTSYTVSGGQTCTLVSDLKSTWLLSDSMSSGSIGATGIQGVTGISGSGSGSNADSLAYSWMVS